MKRLQVMLPDDVYTSLKAEAERRQSTIADIVRRGIDRVLTSSVKAPFKLPALSPRDLGSPALPVEEWRNAANER